MTAFGRSKYSKPEGEPRGHHGQQIHYLIWYNHDDTQWTNVGVISGGSAVYATAPRDQFFSINKHNREKVINGIIDNTVFRLELPKPNLASKILSLWRQQVAQDWQDIYQVIPFGFETFVEFAELQNGAQRIGTIYRADNWTLVGETSGSTKNHVGKGLDGALHGTPFAREKVARKLIFCKWIKPFNQPLESSYRSSWRQVSDAEKKTAAQKAEKRENKKIDALQKAITLGIDSQLYLF